MAVYIESAETTGVPVHERPEDRHGVRDVSALLSRLGKETIQLVRQETELARAELDETLSEAKKGVTAMATSSVITLAGVITSLFGAAWALSWVLPIWAAFLAVGGGVMLIGAALAAVSKKKLEPSNLDLEMTRESLREDRRLVREQVQR